MVPSAPVPRPHEEACLVLTTMAQVAAGINESSIAGLMKRSYELVPYLASVISIHASVVMIGGLSVWCVGAAPATQPRSEDGQFRSETCSSR
jgi:hypothetical protein